MLSLQIPHAREPVEFDTGRPLPQIEGLPALGPGLAMSKGLYRGVPPVGLLPFGSSQTRKRRVAFSGLSAMREEYTSKLDFEVSGSGDLNLSGPLYFTIHELPE